MKTTQFTCHYCHKLSSRSNKEVNLTRKRGLHVYCSRECSNLGHRSPEISKVCKNCGSVFSRPKRHKDTLTFCSKRCSCRFNGKKVGESRRKIKECPKCSSSFWGNYKFCKSCRVVRDGSSVPKVTKSYKYFGRICREHARKVMKKSGLLSECKVCKFSGFVEACHVVPVNKFELTSSLKDINDLKNLVGLCPNCHWMLDHGKLVLP